MAADEPSRSASEQCSVQAGRARSAPDRGQDPDILPPAKKLKPTRPPKPSTSSTSSWGAAEGLLMLDRSNHASWPQPSPQDDPSEGSSTGATPRSPGSNTSGRPHTSTTRRPHRQPARRPAPAPSSDTPPSLGLCRAAAKGPTAAHSVVTPGTLSAATSGTPPASMLAPDQTALRMLIQAQGMARAVALQPMPLQASLGKRSRLLQFFGGGPAAKQAGAADTAETNGAGSSGPPETAGAGQAGASVAADSHSGLGPGTWNIGPKDRPNIQLQEDEQARLQLQRMPVGGSQGQHSHGSGAGRSQAQQHRPAEHGETPQQRKQQQQQGQGQGQRAAAPAAMGRLWPQRLEEIRRQQEQQQVLKAVQQARHEERSRQVEERSGQAERLRLDEQARLEERCRQEDRLRYEQRCEHDRQALLLLLQQQEQQLMIQRQRQHDFDEAAAQERVLRLASQALQQKHDREKEELSRALAIVARKASSSSKPSPTTGAAEGAPAPLSRAGLALGAGRDAGLAVREALSGGTSGAASASRQREWADRRRSINSEVTAEHWSPFRLPKPAAAAPGGTPGAGPSGKPPLSPALQLGRQPSDGTCVDPASVALSHHLSTTSSMGHHYALAPRTSASGPERQPEYAHRLSVTGGTPHFHGGPLNLRPSPIAPHTSPSEWATLGVRQGAFPHGAAQYSAGVRPPLVLTRGLEQEAQLFAAAGQFLVPAGAIDHGSGSMQPSSIVVVPGGLPMAGMFLGRV